jgi:tetratricopeptide (TPR) repeat protein
MAYHNRGNAYYNQGNYAKAVEDLSAALKINPRLLGAYRNRGNAWLKLGDRARAEADFAAAESSGEG